VITLGGSEVPAVLGLDPYLSPYALGARKLDPSLQPEESEAMRLGLRLQGVHAELLEEAGWQVMPAPVDGFAHPDLPWLHGRPDGLVALDGQRAPVELKLRGLAPSESLRQRDTIQALIYAELLAADQALVSELHGGYGGFRRDEWTIERDEELFALVVEHCERFLALLRRGKLPAPDGSDSAREAIRARFAVSDHGSIRLSKAGWQHVRKCRELDELIGNAKAQREKHAQSVQDEMGEAEVAISPHDAPAAKWFQVTSNRLDTKALKAALPEIAAEFSKTTTTRRFEVNP
jgi:predicted phage-related endonuclease